MERHERYDPEDIEGLLRERDFDELLAEERDFVLRHLSGREEYQDMRALLRRMDLEEGGTDAPEAPAHVREAVLAAFRREQAPLWRIWLNAVGQALWPSHVRLLLRPAMALATVALLVVAGVLVVRWMGVAQEGDGLAEVRPAQQERAEPKAAPSELKEAVVMDTLTDEQSSGAMEAEQRLAETRGVPEAPKEAPMTAPAQEESIWMSDDLAEEVSDAEHEERSDVDMAAGASGRTVTADELARNMSLANAAPKSEVLRERTIQKKKAVLRDDRPLAKGRNLAQDAALIDLLSAGW